MRKSHRGGLVSAISQTPMIENLEGRVLLSASLVRGVLKVTGTAGNDTITLGLNSAKTRIFVQEGATAKQFNKTAVKSISINSGDGDDHVLINNGIKAQITIKAGEGVDLVHGGSGREFIFGGGGNDELRGGGGGDFISGEAGDDQIFGDAGNDYLYGDAGNDNLSGGTGNDVLGGDNENTLVFRGQPASDVVGNDSLDGGDGNDWLLGGTRVVYDENDPELDPLFLTSNGADRFTGGAGADVVQIGGGDDTFSDEESADFVPVNEALHVQEGNPGDVHTHVVLKIRVRSGSRYKNAIVQPHMGFFPSFLAALHTHPRPAKLSGGANVIHYEAPPASPRYSLNDFFRVIGISMDANHIGRFLPAAGTKMTMWITRNGRTTQNKSFGKFVPVGHIDAARGDVVEIRVG